MTHIKALSLVFLLLCSLTLPLISAVNGEDATHTLSGTVYDSEGNTADTTYIKVVPMASVLSDSSDGTYEFTGISTGLHSARAYFMNNGHTVSYRALYMDSDLTNAGRAKSLPSIESTQPEITVERNPDGKGYEWYTDAQETSWYRNEGSISEWQRFEA